MSSQFNSQNWIEGVNRYSLAKPPTWFLSALWDFDASLVIIPSEQHSLYRLAQRRKVNLPDHIIKDPIFQQSDSQMMARHGLVPVTTIMPTINWADPENFMELARRAPWRNGGHEAVSKRMEEEEAAIEAKKREAQDEHLASLAKDAWGFYNKKIGVRSHMYIPRSKSSVVSKSKSPSIRIK
jgi:hypothetical protein